MTNFKDLNTVCGIMYATYLIDSDADMEDFQAMWEALLLQRGIPIPESWEAFLYDINSTLSDKRDHFDFTFDKHFKNKNYEPGYYLERQTWA